MDNLLALVCLFDWMAQWVKNRDAAMASAFKNAKRAVALDETFSTAHATLGEIHMFRREFDDARYWLERAIELNPNDANSLGQYGLYLMRSVAPTRRWFSTTFRRVSTRFRPIGWTG